MNSQIILGDCRDVLERDIPAASVDVVVTSPCYNWGKDYKGVDDSMPWPVYWDLMSTTAAKLLPALKPDGILFLQTGSKSNLPTHSEEIRRRFTDAGFVLQEHIIWQKATEDGHGHFTPINSKRYVNSMFEDIWILSKENAFEDIWILSKEGKAQLDRLAVGVPYSDPTNTTRWAHGSSIRCRGDIWFLPHKTIQNRDKDRDGHGATFPEALVERCLLLAGKPAGAVVLDPFAGRGTTPVVATRMGYRGVGIEKSPELAQAAARNLQAVLDLQR